MFGRLRNPQYEKMSHEELKEAMEKPVKTVELEILKDTIYVMELFTAANTFMAVLLFIMYVM